MDPMSKYRNQTAIDWCIVCEMSIPFLFQRKCVAPTGDQLCDAHVWPANGMQCLWETTQVLAGLFMFMNKNILKQ